MPDNMSLLRPYKGPSPYDEADAENFFGREADIGRLRGILRTERIVVLHAPSGAGKTSLIQAGIQPRMRQDGFKTLPPLRVNHPIPEHIDADSMINRFSYSIMHSIEAALASNSNNVATKVKEDDFIGIPLSTYFAHRSALRAWEEKLFLIFDQFEEIFTIEPYGRSEKLRFFGELGKVLQERRIWALFAIKEEYLGSLDDYSRTVPTNFANRYKLDILTRSSAEDAIRKPVERLNMSFDDEALTKMLDDLTYGKDQSQPGSREDEREKSRKEDEAPIIDPLYLQLMCEQVWAAAQKEEMVRITSDAVTRIQKMKNQEDLSAVETALMDFYGNTMRQAAEKHDCKEREIRDWIDQELIAEGRRRRPAIAEMDSESPMAKAQCFLEDQHILRASPRVGAKWYELVHDRLVLPVCKSNEKWYRANLSPFEQTARQWKRFGKPQDFRILPKKEWQKYDPGLRDPKLPPPPNFEKEYFVFCKNAYSGLRRSFIYILAILILGVTAAGGVLLNNFKSEKVKITQNLNTIAQLNKMALQQRYTYQNHDVALLLGTLAQRFCDSRPCGEAGKQKWSMNLDSQKAVWAALEATPFCRTLPALTLGAKPESLIPYHGGVGMFIKKDKKRKIAFLDLRGEREAVQSVEACGDSPQSFFLNDGYVAVVDIEKDLLRVVSAQGCKSTGEEVLPPEGFKLASKAPVYSHDNKFCAAYLENGSAAIYGVDSKETGIPRHTFIGLVPKMPWCIKDNGHEGVADISAVAFNKTHVAIGDRIGGVRIFELGSGQMELKHSFQLCDGNWPSQKLFNEYPSYASIVAISISGENPEWLTTVHVGGLFAGGGCIMRRSLSGPGLPFLVRPDLESIRREEQSRKLRIIADMPSGEAYRSAYFDPEGQTLVTGGDQGSVILWNLRNSEEPKEGITSDPSKQRSTQEDKPSQTKHYAVERLLFPGMTGSAQAVLSASIKGDDHNAADGKAKERTLIVGLDSDRGVRIWELNRRNEGYIEKEMGESGYLYDLAFRSDSELITTNNQGKISLWRLKRQPLRIEGEELPVPKPGDKPPSIRAMDIHGNYLVTGWRDNKVRVQDISSGLPPQELEDPNNSIAHTEGLWSAAFRPQDPDLKKRFDLATGDANGKIVFWDLAAATDGSGLTSRVFGECQFEKRNLISALSFDPKGRLLLASTSPIPGIDKGEPKGNLYLIDMEGGCKESENSACQGGPCVVWSASKMKEEDSLPPINAAAFSADGLKFAAGGDCGMVRWWELRKAGMPSSLKSSTGMALDGARNKINALAFLPGSEMLATAGQDGILRIWDLRIKPQVKPEETVASDSDRENLSGIFASGALQEGEPLTLKQAGTELRSLAVSQDNPPLIAAGDAHGRFHIWDFDTKLYACRMVLRNLTWQEWKESVKDRSTYTAACPDRPCPPDLPPELRSHVTCDTSKLQK